MAYCYFNGEVIDESKASISIHNLGVQRGFGVFDLFRGRAGKPVFMEDHLDRFDQSQQFLGLDRLVEKEEIREAIDALQEKNRFKESSFKLLILGDGSESEPALKPLFFIINADLSGFKNPECAMVILHEYLREYPLIKSINYLTSNQLHRQRMKAGAIDVIYHKDGIISEASRSNVFIVKDGVIRTPKRNILEGITRKQILTFGCEIATIEIGEVTLSEFHLADEVFISSTLKEIMPVVAIDGNEVRDGRVGPLTQRIKESFFDHLS